MRRDFTTIGTMKWECHRLIDIIWGTSKHERAQAYAWLAKNCAIHHFANINDYGTLFIARKKLQKKALEEGALTVDEFVV